MIASTSVLVICFVIFARVSCRHGLYKIEYNPKKASHKVLLALCVLLCISVSAVIFALLSKKNLTYPYEYELRHYNAYEQLFDALMKHQLNLDVEVDEIFGLFNNPYDYAERSSIKFSYLWDRVLFDGKYYSYFGIAPILLVYFPFYFITKKVPTAETVCFIFTVVTIIAIAFLVVKAQKIFVKKVNLLLLAFSLLAVESGSLIFMIQSSADMYYTAISSGITFLALYLLFSFSAYDSKKVVKKCIYFALSGLSLSFLVMSRPNLAVFFIIVIPIYLSTIISKDYKVSQKLWQVISFAIPVCAGAAVVMWYNYARFGSVFEFGAKYQLTIHDVSDYAFTPALFLPSLFYYFIQPAFFEKAFPFLKIPYLRLPYDGYLYVTSTIGAFSFPSVLGFVLFPSSISLKNDKVKSSVFITAFASLIALAFFDTCMAGVNIRYLADIMLVAVLFSSMIIADFYRYICEVKTDKTQFAVHLLFCLLTALTFIMGMLLILNNERDYIVKLFS